MSDTIFHEETYIVRFDYQQPNGYWKMNAEEAITIRTPDHLLKDNHDKAEEIVEKKYLALRIECKVWSVTYV